MKIMITNMLRFILLLTGCMTGLSFPVFAQSYGPALNSERHTLFQNGVERGYIVRLPHDSALRGGSVPLVLVLHGGGGNPGNVETITGFTEKARSEGFIVVYPEGSGRFKDKLMTWNAGHCCGYAMEKQVDDVSFISAVIDKLIEDYPVDTKRIYATGISNGGMMTHRLGIELSSRFAAIAPVVATLFGDEKHPTDPVSAIMLNGMLDQSVPYQGGPPGGRLPRAWDGAHVQPAREQALFWAAANDCTKVPEKYDRVSFVMWQYHCPDGRDVEIYLVKDNGHAWPGGRPGNRKGDKPSSSLAGTDVIWDFFKKHSKK